MKFLLRLLLILLTTLSNAHATLIDRGGGLIYDSALNITWLQDANYAKSSGYDTDGIMSWASALAWASQLEYGSYDDWRLPRIIDIGNDGCNYSTTGGTDCGYNIDVYSSEMGHLFYTTLGGIAFYDTSGIGPQIGFGLGKSSPFNDIKTGPQDFYWSSTAAMNVPSDAWYFGFVYGDQSPTSTTNLSFPSYAWAVRDGDVTASAVPEPAILQLLLTGLITLVLRGAIMRRTAAAAVVPAPNAVP